MSGTGATALTALAAVGSGTVGGVFFAFDSFVLRGLGRLPDGLGADAMRSINVTAVRPAFMTALFGTAALAVGVVVLGARSSETVERVLLVGGGGAYLVGTVLTTIMRNLPLNDALEARRGATWTQFLAAWSRANRVRTAGSLAASAAFTVALARP
ncbi:DUF1772 domain-containing protein [Georgenia sp. SYP-B2076]|uniref:anthrone oxygenase family protein n=1 Tax=Georgenia sp. SYP-B2076 TaxID=2495881 RepID=UPI000F8F1581|nr:anthrone oxygenase family protein [Georgenia sp. SYP-B2076]